MSHTCLKERECACPSPGTSTLTLAQQAENRRQAEHLEAARQSAVKRQAVLQRRAAEDLSAVQVHALFYGGHFTEAVAAAAGADFVCRVLFCASSDGTPRRIGANPGAVTRE